MNVFIVNLTSEQEWSGHSCNRADPEQGQQRYRYRDYPAKSGHVGPARAPSGEATPDDLRVAIDVDSGPSSMLLTYDAQDKRVSHRPDAYVGGTVTFKVHPARLPLHDAMTDAPTRRYVVAGDTLELIDASVNFQWLKVRYRNPHAGAVQGWVSAKEVTGN
nr:MULTISPECIES: hypothetical protein [Burkholderia cepacia complex]